MTYDDTIAVYKAFVTIYSHINDKYETGNRIPYLSISFKHPLQTSRAVKFVETKKGYALQIKLGTDTDTFIEEFINIIMKRLINRPPLYKVDPNDRGAWVRFFKEHLSEIAK